MNIIFMINLPETHKPGRTSSYDYSIKSWTHYAQRCDAQLIVLTERVYPESYMNANWHKIFVLDLLENSEIEYDKVLIVDSDTIIHPLAPNIFDIVGDGFYAVHNDGSYDWMLRSMENYSFHIFDNFKFPFTQYFNSGFIVVNKRHKEFLSGVADFYRENRDKLVWMQETYGVGTDQPVLNFMVHMKIQDQLTILPYEWNMQELPRREVLDLQLTFLHYGWMYHFNGIPPRMKINTADDRPAVEQWMHYVYNSLYS